MHLENLIHHTSLRKTKITNISKVIHLSGMLQIGSIMANLGALLMKTLIFILIFRGFWAF